jgi:PAS domain S-box-containing protein
MASSSFPVTAQRSALRKYLLTGIVALLATAALWPILGRGSSFYMPHWYCFMGDQPLIYTHLVSDLVIGLSYVAISVTLAWIVHRAHRTIPFHWLFLAFGMFIIACGGTHFMEVVTLFKPLYWLSAYVKGVTAVASLATAIALPLVTPSILAHVESASVSEERRVKLEAANRELERAAADLKELDQLKTSLVAQRAADLGTWEWQPPSNRVVWSETVETMHGLVPGSFDGRFESWLATVHQDDRERVRAAVATALKSGDYDVEYRTVRPDGSAYWTAARGRVSFDQHGQPTRMVGSCMDIDARKRAGMALAQQARVLDLANDAILVLDTAGCITFWNRGAERLYGWSKEQATGQNAHDLLRTEFPQPLETIEAEVWKNGQWQGELKHTTRAGVQVIVTSLWNPHVDEDGRRLGIFEINRDITAQKRAEEALRRSEKLAAAGRLAATIAHEINNPLEAVTNLIYLIGNDPSVGAGSREYLQMAERELHRVSQLTKQTLGFYRSNSRPEWIDVGEMLNEVVSIYSGRLQSKGVQVEKRYDGGEVVQAVAGELRQVFSNLVANAIDALPHGGRLTLRLYRQQRNGRRGVRVTVADTGSGIAPEHRDSIFEPFFTTKKDIGTGLGLWVAQEIVTKHGGQIRFRSRVAAGTSWTVFSVFLPEFTAQDQTTSAQCA